MTDKQMYEQFAGELGTNKTRARVVLNCVIRKLNRLIVQNRKAMESYNAILSNQNYYLHKRLKQRKGLKDYHAEKVKLFQLRKRLLRLGNFYIESAPDGSKTYFPKLTRKEILILRSLIKNNAKRKKDMP